MQTLDLDFTLPKIINYKRTSLETQLPPSHTIMQDWLWVSDDVPVYENGILALTSLV